MNHVELGLAAEVYATQVLCRTVAAVADGQLARVGLDVRDELLHILCRHVRVHDQQQWSLDQKRKRREVLDRVICHVRVNRRVDGHEASRSEQ